MDNLSTQTGITRFLEKNRNHGWLYNKTEELTKNDLKNKFTHLLVEAEFVDDKKLEIFQAFLNLKSLFILNINLNFLNKL